MLLNLVKRKEKRKQESILTEEITKTIHYLNQFLPPEHHIEHIPFDMTKTNKSAYVNHVNLSYNALPNFIHICVITSLGLCL